MRTTNPALPDTLFNSVRNTRTSEGVMTLQGTAIKGLILLFLALLSAGWTWSKFTVSNNNPESVSTLMTVGVFAGFILAMITIFKANLSPYLAPLYALCEGLFLGGISAMMEVQFPGIAIQAVSITFAALASMLLLYQSGLVQVTPAFRTGIVIATGAVALVYLIGFILSFFSINMPILYGNSLVSIGFSLLVVGIATFNFMLDFDFIDKGVKSQAPKYMEWYGAFSLMITLVWLYIEVLRLLAKVRSRD